MKTKKTSTVKLRFHSQAVLLEHAMLSYENRFLRAAKKVKSKQKRKEYLFLANCAGSIGKQAGEATLDFIVAAMK